MVEINTMTNEFRVKINIFFVFNKSKWRFVVDYKSIIESSIPNKLYIYLIKSKPISRKFLIG